MKNKGVRQMLPIFRDDFDLISRVYDPDLCFLPKKLPAYKEAPREIAFLRCFAIF